jgi:hypothetical protein
MSRKPSSPWLRKCFESCLICMLRSGHTGIRFTLVCSCFVELEERTTAKHKQQPLHKSSFLHFLLCMLLHKWKQRDILLICNLTFKSQVHTLYFVWFHQDFVASRDWVQRNTSTIFTVLIGRWQWLQYKSSIAHFAGVFTLWVAESHTHLRKTDRMKLKNQLCYQGSLSTLVLIALCSWNQIK